MFKTLVKHGIWSESRPEIDTSEALLRAAQHGKDVCVSMLLGVNANVGVTDRLGRSPLLLASTNVKDTNIELLLNLVDLVLLPPSLVVCDASFISLLKLIPRPLALTADTADLIALIKPQFEVGRAAIGKGGLVKSENDRRRAVDTVCSGLEATTDFAVKAVIDSPVEGGDGNREYLMAASRIRNRPDAG